MWCTWSKDLHHHGDWFGNMYRDSTSLIIHINEPVVQKEKSIKAVGNVECVIDKDVTQQTIGNMIVYFQKDSSSLQLQYGDRIIIRQALARIKNSGNPGCFNYERYAAFHQLYYTVYLKKGSWRKLNQTLTFFLDRLIFSMQHYIINVLTKYITGDKNVLGIAEALLIGYKEDLDKDLVQVYSNAGVVHIIAISGLHLGLIYVLLVWIFNRLPIIKKYEFIKVSLILICLWLFSLLTGANPSILRSAVMFTCIIIGKTYFKQSSIYNSLAASAFLLLCFNPYFLWDVGFQLSYLAVIGIISLQKPIESLVYCKNKWIAKVWSMLAVTLAAQLITFPICIFYFHQFPNLFFITNLLIVPLSTVILFIEILLISFSPIQFIAILLGKLSGASIWLMNFVTTYFTKFSFSVSDNISATLTSTCFLYLFLIAACCLFVQKEKKYLPASLILSFLYVSTISFSAVRSFQQKKIIIYNIPQFRAIDFVERNRYSFLGDSVLLSDGLLKNFHLKPARISMQLKGTNKSISSLSIKNNLYTFNNKSLLLIDSSFQFQMPVKRIKIDFILLSKNSLVKIDRLSTIFDVSRIIFDSSNSLWKIANWKKDCERLALPFYSIPEQGAFILDLE